MRKNLLKFSGFTLIELMVVISIIAILATVGIVSYQVVLKNSRDARRLGDLRTIQTGLEQYFADQLFYPSAIGSSLTNCTGGVTGCTVSKTYLNIVPTDPLTSGRTAYNFGKQPDTCDNNTATKCTSYCLYARFEITPSAPATCVPTAPLNFSVTLP